MILLRPVDCDEILGVFTSDGLSFTRKDIHAAFDVLHTSGKRGGFRIETSLFNVPGETGWYVPVGFFHKGFVSSHVQAVCDNGHHEPTSATDPTIYHSLFTYLHEHNVEYHLWRQRLKRKLKRLVEPDEPEKLRQHLASDRPEGAHAAQAYSMSGQEYYERYNTRCAALCRRPHIPTGCGRGAGCAAEFVGW